MKKHISGIKTCLVIVMCMGLAFSLNVAFGSTQENTYSNEEAGVLFNVPQGWQQAELIKEREFIETKYVKDNGHTFIFGYADLWGALPENERADIKRRDVNNDIFTMEDVEKMTAPGNTTVTGSGTDILNNIEYFYIDLTGKRETDGFEYSVGLRNYVSIMNGYMYFFSYSGSLGDTEFQEFLTVLKSAKYDFDYITQDAMKTSMGIPYNYSDTWVYIGFVISVLYTIVLYSAPIIIYRYFVLKNPAEPSKSKKIAIAYGIFSFILAVVIGTLTGDKSPGGAVLLWSFINYHILTHGKSKHNATVASGENSDHKSNEVKCSERSGQDSPNGHVEESTRCIKCKAQLSNGSIFCDKCGTKQ